MIYGEHAVNDAVEVHATMGYPGNLKYGIMGIKVGGEGADLTRTDVERLRDLCEEALA